MFTPVRLHVFPTLENHYEKQTLLLNDNTIMNLILQNIKICKYLELQKRLLLTYSQVTNNNIWLGLARQLSTEHFSYDLIKAILIQKL